MEAMETFELPTENAAAVTEKRCYTVEDLQIILGISRGISTTMKQPENASRNGKALRPWQMRNAERPKLNIGRN